ncbi:hypothetical protein FB451DRAFT_1392463 [Mycena latifolia]|nr:hypothetical protein FB451DRAFT_1392463 [Mycena latifolia]
MPQTTGKRPRVVDSSSEDEGSASDVVNLDEMSLADLKKVVRESQLRMNNAEKKLRKALVDKTNSPADEDHENSRRASKKSKQRPTKRRHIEIEEPMRSSDDGSAPASDDSEAEDDKDEREQKVATLGRCFVLQKGLWLKDGTLDAKLDKGYDVKKRFDGAQVQGQLRDVLDILPDRYKGKVMREKWFQRAFSQGMSSQRSNTSTRIRRVAGHAIYDCSAADLLDPSARRQFREEIGWYEFEDGDGGEYASLDVPILHKDGSKVYDIHTCFLNPVLMRLFVAIIRGTNAAISMLRNDSDGCSDIPKTDNMEHIHRIDHTEPGAIAAACVLAIWGKSTDVCLRARGDHTNIDYEHLFDEYLDILTTGLRKKSPSILHVFAEWDRIVFPHAETSHVDAEKQGSGRKSDGYQRAMEAMRAEADEERREGGTEGEHEDEGHDGPGAAGSGDEGGSAASP